MKQFLQTPETFEPPVRAKRVKAKRFRPLQELFHLASGSTCGGFFAWRLQKFDGSGKPKKSPRSFVIPPPNGRNDAREAALCDGEAEMRDIEGPAKIGEIPMLMYVKKTDYRQKARAAIGILIIGALFIVVGLLNIISGIQEDIRFSRFKEEATVGTAVIAKIEHKTGMRRKYQKSDDLYIHHILFQVNGALYTMKQTYYNFSMQVGQKVKILYKPEAPQKVYIDRNVNLVGDAMRRIMPVAAGLVFAFIAIQVRRNAKKPLSTYHLTDF